MRGSGGDTMEKKKKSQCEKKGSKAVGTEKNLLKLEPWSRSVKQQCEISAAAITHGRSFSHLFSPSRSWGAQRRGQAGGREAEPWQQPPGQAQLGHPYSVKRMKI